MYKATKIGSPPMLDIANCFPGLYQPVTPNSMIGKCEVQFHWRLMTALPCTLGSNTLLLPFLVDTGAKSTRLHSLAFEKFEVPVPGKEFDLVIHDKEVEASVNHVSDGVHDLSTTTSSAWTSCCMLFLISFRTLLLVSVHC